ncbi:glycosyltransferase [Parasedimentitalea psychrophila]|uniref:Glycosyltransferase n=1 Tax=Parasedimentitalea psychrophila TaxID=2997337 RepID=A0A9Y2P6S4_9RHOB|nr:glycosyltransferase [Parasedimentitalea psychrophila]WIY27734.1 glycosyltransferase [Parasedimentitalea psychrophila]
MTKIRILALTKSTGGISFYNKMLLAALDPAKFESHTICLSDNAEAYAANLQAAGQSAEVFAMARYRISPASDLAVLRHVLAVARDRRSSLLLGHGSKAGFIARAAGRIAGIPAIYRQASMPFLRRFQGGKAPIYWALEHGAGRLGGKTVAITEHARRETLAKRVATADAIQVIRTGIDTGQFQPQGIRDTVAAELGLDPARPIVGWLGRLEPQKAPLDYVAALRKVAPSHPGVQFVIAGEGSLRAEVERQLNDTPLDNVRLLPWQDDPGRAYQAMDIFAMSSLWEGLPLTLLEAMASGCAPISTTVDGCAEAIENGVSGLLIPPASPAAMAAALDDLLSSPDRRRAFASAARQRVQQLFDRRRMVGEWETLLSEQAAAGTGRGPKPAPPATSSRHIEVRTAQRRTGLRICMVISSYHPVVGGAEKQVAQLARIMISKGHLVRVITRRYPGLSAMEVIDGVEVQRVRTGGAKAQAAASFITGAARAIRQYAPDVVHCHSAFSPTLAGLLARSFGKLPLIVKPMCSGEITSVLEKRGGSLRRAALKRRVDYFIAVSREIEDELQQFGFAKRQILRIPNGVDTATFRPCGDPAEKSELRHNLGLPDGTLFLFAGRIARQKRLPLLLEAWPEVRSRCPDAKLLIAGANRMTSSGFNANVGDAEQVPPHLLTQEGVFALGHVDDMPAYLRASDIFVLPSAREGLSNALLEACACGLAVIASQIGGTQDLIENGKNGRLFAPDNLAELTEAMIKLAGDAEQRQILGAAAAETICQQFDIRQTADRLLMAYASLCEAETAAPAATARNAPDPDRRQGS